MPFRETPHPLAEAVGARIRQLRLEQKLTQEGLAYEAGLKSKGHLSGVKKGVVMPTPPTLVLLAERLGVEVFDLFVFPGGLRARVVDGTRRAPNESLRAALDALAPTRR